MIIIASLDNLSLKAGGPDLGSRQRNMETIWFDWMIPGTLLHHFFLLITAVFSARQKKLGALGDKKDKTSLCPTEPLSHRTPLGVFRLG